MILNLKRRSEMLIIIDQNKKSLTFSHNGKTLFLKELDFCLFDVFEKELTYPDFSDYKNALAFIDEYSKSEKGDVFLENGTRSLINYAACEISVISKEVTNDIELPAEIQRYIPQRIKMTLKIDFFGFKHKIKQ